MSDITLINAQIREGIWEGVIVVAEENTPRPEVEIVHLEKPLENVRLVEDPVMKNLWNLSVPIPAKLLSDGVQTFLVRDRQTEETLDRFVIVAGQPLEDDLRAEIDLLRAELDMLKKAFRRHCTETAG